MKYIGMCIVFVNSTAIGILINRMNVKRLKDLKDLKKFILGIKNEINYGLTPLCETIEMMCQKEKNDIGKFFGKYNDYLEGKNEGNIKAVDQEKMMAYLYKTNLVKKERNQLIEFLDKIAGKDKDTMVQNLLQMIEQISESISTIKSNQEKNGKLYQTLGVMLGILVIIMFI